MSRRKPKLQRERVYALITREVRRFAKAGRVDIIDDLLTYGLGWCSNFNERPAEDAIRALLALVPVSDVDEIEHVADTAIWHRELLKGASYDAARLRAARVLAPLGVRYAPCGCLAWAAGDQCCSRANPPTEQEIVEAREARALGAARKAIDTVADDPEAVRLLIGMTTLMGSRELKERAA